MIAETHRRPLVAVPPVLMTPLGLVLRPALATLFAMVAPFRVTLALRPLGTLRPLLGSRTAMLRATIAALRTLAALICGTMSIGGAVSALLGGLPVAAVSTLVGTT